MNVHTKISPPPIRLQSLEVTFCIKSGKVFCFLWHSEDSFVYFCRTNYILFLQADGKADIWSCQAKVDLTILKNESGQLQLGKKNITYGK